MTFYTKYFEDVYITYAPGDNGGALGAAFVVSAKCNDKKENAIHFGGFLGFQTLYKAPRRHSYNGSETSEWGFPDESIGSECGGRRAKREV